jgi:hypothetical protein
MEPTAEQLIRDYLNRLSVAARTRLRSDDRRAFLARTREFIESRSGAGDPEDVGRVQEALARLGDPATAVEHERDRLAAERGRRAAARSGLWRPQPRGSATDAGAQPGSDAASDPRPAPRGAPAPRRYPRAAVDVSHLTGRELTGDIEKKVKVNRPVTSRWRPGAPAKPRPSRADRIPQPRSGGSPTPDTGPSGGPSGGPRSAGPPSAGAPAGSPPGGPQAVAPGNGVSAPASFGAVPPTVAPPDATSPAGPEVAGPEVAGPEVAGPEVAGPEVAGPEPVLPGQMPPPWTMPGAVPTVAMPARRARAPRSARAFGSRWRPQRGQLTDVRRGAAGSAAGFWRRHRLEATSVALLAVGALIYPYPIWVLGFALWLFGAILAVPSKLWSLWDKWTGLLGPVALAIAGTAAGLALGGTRPGVAAYVHEALADARYMIPLGALLGAGYLGWRALRGRQTPPVPPWNRPHRI